MTFLRQVYDSEQDIIPAARPRDVGVILRLAWLNSFIFASSPFNSAMRRDSSASCPFSGARSPARFCPVDDGPRDTADAPGAWDP